MNMKSYYLVTIRLVLEIKNNPKARRSNARILK